MHSYRIFGLKFTPWEFETNKILERIAKQVKVKFTPLEFET